MKFVFGTHCLNVSCLALGTNKLNGLRHKYSAAQGHAAYLRQVGG